jgi:lipopolysaccharide export LptBFGC system permease protein LptF
MILQRYILREIVATFLMVFLAISLIIFIGIGIQQYRRLEGLGFLFLVKSLPFLFCFAVRYSLPASMLMASVLVFGRLAAENEIVAIRAGGIPLWRVVHPALAVGLGVSLGFLLFNDYVAPRAIHQQRTLAQQGILGTLSNPPPVGTVLQVSNCRILYKRYRHGVFEEFALTRVGEKEEVQTVWAKEARFLVGEDQPPRFLLHHVVMLAAQEKTPLHNWPIAQARTYEYVLDIEPLLRRAPKLYEIPTPDLIPMTRGNTGGAGENRREAVLAERHQRIAWALGPFVLTLLGAPIGILLRKGSRLAGFGASLPGGTVYFLLATMGHVFATRLHMNPVAVVWFADGLFFLVGAVLLWRVYRI